MLEQLSIIQSDLRKLIIKTLPDLLLYVQSQSATVKNRNFSLYSRTFYDLSKNAPLNNIPTISIQNDKKTHKKLQNQVNEMQNMWISDVKTIQKDKQTTVSAPSGLVLQGLRQTERSDTIAFYGYGSKKLAELHSENVYLYIDKYFETCIPDIQTEFLFESIGLSECDYDAWLQDALKYDDGSLKAGPFWVNHCDNDGVLSEYITPIIKGGSYNPYIRFLSSKTSGSEQVQKLLDLVGCNFINLDVDPFPVVFNLLTLTFPDTIAFLLLDPVKRDIIIKKMWKCYKLFFKELHRYYGLSFDETLGSSASLHLWSSSFPFLPHPHFHVGLPHFSYLNVNDTLDGGVHCRNNTREIIESCSVTGAESDKEFCNDCVLSDTCVSRGYDKLYSLITELDVSSLGMDKKIHRFIDKLDFPEFADLQVAISKELAHLLHFNPLPWDGKMIKTSTRGIDYDVPLPIDVDVFRSMWSDCVNGVFKKELGDKLALDLDVSIEPTYDIHNQWVTPDQKAKLMHYFQYKCRPPILDLDLFFKKCQNFVTGYTSLDPSIVISLIRTKWVYAVLHDDISGANRYGSLLQKAEYMFKTYSSDAIYKWLQFLCTWQTQTRVFGFWRSIKRYRITSVIRGPLPRSHICPICGGITERVCMVDVLCIDAIVIHLGSRYLVIDIKDPPF